MKEQLVDSAAMQYVFVDAIEGFSDAEIACLNEMRDVLAKHGKLERFAVSRLRNDVYLEEKDFAMEYTDSNTRVQHMYPHSWDTESFDYKLTNVRFDTNSYSACAGCYYVDLVHSGHAPCINKDSLK